MDGRVLKGLEAEIQPGTRAGTDPASDPTEAPEAGSCLQPRMATAVSFCSISPGTWFH